MRGAFNIKYMERLSQKWYYKIKGGKRSIDVYKRQVFGQAGGAAVQMVAKAGAITCARLIRDNGNYILTLSLIHI